MEQKSQFEFDSKYKGKLVKEFKRSNTGLDCGIPLWLRCNAGDSDLIPGSGGSLGEKNVNIPQYWIN